MSSYIRDKVLNNKEEFDRISDEAFKSVDKDGSNFIDQEELEKIMVQISIDMGADPPTKEDVKEIMEVLDKDNSNQIDRVEFKELIRNILSALIE